MTLYTKNGFLKLKKNFCMCSFGFHLCSVKILFWDYSGLRKKLIHIIGNFVAMLNSLTVVICMKTLIIHYNNIYMYIALGMTKMVVYKI